MPAAATEVDIELAGTPLAPAAVLAVWAGGIALGAVLVAYWRIVGPGFFWMMGATVAVLAAGAAAAGGGIAAWVSAVGAIVGMALARRPVPVMAAFAVSTVGALTAALAAGGGLIAVTALLALGGVTDEMLLGHWYLVNPRMPRSALKALAAIGLVGLVLDTAAIALMGPAAGTVTWTFWLLATTSVLLMVGVWFALDQPSYPGVMAATGLSYLAVLTTLGAVIAGRAAIWGV